MRYDILLATKNRSLATNFKRAVNITRSLQLDNIDSSSVQLPITLNRLFKKRGRILEVMILDLTLPTEELNRIIFYIKRYRKDLPVILLHLERSFSKEGRALRNLSVYACITKPSSKSEAAKILSDLSHILDLDMDKKLEKIEYLERENIFACTFKNLKTYFLPRGSIKEDDGSKIKHCAIEEDGYYFTVYLESGSEYTVPWDFILSICEKKYAFYKDKEVEGISPQEIGKRLKEFRQSRRFTQEALATQTGILRPNIARMEKGKHYPSLENLKKIASALKVPVAKLLVR